MSKFLRQLEDSSIDERKIGYKDEIELVYLRHRYFRKSTNPTPERLAVFEEMLCNISNKIYLRNIEVFKTVGMEMEDLRNIARVHTVSFISMDGLPENPDKMEKFRKQHKNKYGQESEPKARDFFLKESYNLSSFLNQRLQEVAKVSKSKNANIRGTRSYKRYYIGDASRSPSDIDLFEDPKLFGYKKLTEVQYKKEVKANEGKGKSSFLNQDGQMVRAVYIKGSFLTVSDLDETAIDPRKNFYYRNPEDTLILKEMFKEIEEHDIIG